MLSLLAHGPVGLFVCACVAVSQTAIYQRGRGAKCHISHRVVGPTPHSSSHLRSDSKM